VGEVTIVAYADVVDPCLYFTGKAFGRKVRPAPSPQCRAPGLRMGAVVRPVPDHGSPLPIAARPARRRVLRLLRWLNAPYASTRERVLNRALRRLKQIVAQQRSLSKFTRLPTPLRMLPMLTSSLTEPPAFIFTPAPASLVASLALPPMICPSFSRELPTSESRTPALPSLTALTIPQRRRHGKAVRSAGRRSLAERHRAGYPHRRQPFVARQANCRPGTLDRIAGFR